MGTSTETETARDRRSDRPDRIELWVQPLAGDGPEFEQIVDRLQDLQRRGRIDSFTVRSWDREVAADRRVGERERVTRDRLSTFVRWARRHGTTLAGLGEWRRVGVGRMGSSTDVRRVPRAVLAEYRGDRLVRVTPCAREDVAVIERLDGLVRERARDRSERTRIRN